MSLVHKDLAAGRWAGMSFIEQMANIGSEVERALNWRAKDNAEYSTRAFERALELIDLSLDAHRQFPRLKELARARELLVDFFGSNQYSTPDTFLRKYFLDFAVAARLHT